MQKPSIVIDLNSVPDGLTLEQLVHIYETRGIILWDSTRSDFQPHAIVVEEHPEIKFIDYSKLTEEKRKKLL